MSVSIDDLYFALYADLDNDGVAEALRYSSTTRVPDISDTGSGRMLPLARVATMDGGAVILQGGRSGYADQRAPGSLSLSWPIADDDLLLAAEEEFMRGRLVKICLDHRWRQLRVTSSGTANLTVTVAAGYLLSGNDTYYLRVDTALVCGASDTVVYATPSDGLLTIDSGTSVPTGSVALATITVAGSIVTVATSPSGVANARQGYLTEYTPTQAGANYTALSMVLQEVY